MDLGQFETKGPSYPGTGGDGGGPWDFFLGYGLNSRRKKDKGFSGVWRRPNTELLTF